VALRAEIETILRRHAFASFGGLAGEEMVNEQVLIMNGLQLFGLAETPVSMCGQAVVQ
jgi:hypothetical protein